MAIQQWRRTHSQMMRTIFFYSAIKVSRSGRVAAYFPWHSFFYILSKISITAIYLVSFLHYCTSLEKVTSVRNRAFISMYIRALNFSIYTSSGDSSSLFPCLLYSSRLLHWRLHPDSAHPLVCHCHKRSPGE